MSGQGHFWCDPDVGFSKRQVERIAGFRAWLRKCGIPVAQLLADPENYPSGLACSRAEMEKLEKSILEESSSLSSAHLDRQILSKAVARLNHTGAAHLPQPRFSNLIHLPISPLRADIAEALRRAQAWLRMEAAWIRGCAQSPPVELVVLSAILHSGLWHKSSVVQLARGLFHPEKAFGIAGDCVVLDMSLPWRGRSAMEGRFCRLDAQTTGLIRPAAEYQNSAEYAPGGISGGGIDAWTDETLAARLFRGIVRQLRVGEVDAHLRPASFAELLNTVSLCARTELPPVLVEYATRRIVSHSLKPHSMRRICALDFGNAEESMHAEDSDEQDIEPAADCEIDDDLEPLGLIKLREALRTPVREDAVRRLDALLREFGDVSSTWYLVASFAQYLLTRRNERRRGIFALKRLRVSTARAYALTVGRRLGRMAGDMNFLEADAQAMETQYTRVLENVTEGANPQRLRRAVALVLREFHEYLCLEHRAAAIKVREVLGINYGLLSVDANIITVEEYLEARRIIRWEMHAELNERIRRVAEAMLILGFRCGTRRMEARDLRLDDLIDQGEPWLLIRPRQERELKTANAIRQVPLAPFLSQEELGLLRGLKRSRETRMIGTDNYLFGIPELGLRVVDEDALMRIIHKALRIATRDNTVHYHHLRHSFASFTLLRLMLADLPRIPDLFPHLPSTTAWLRKSKSFRIMLYGTGALTRRHAYAVASLLGHCGPEISIEHYVHSLDWLLPLYLADSKLFSPQNIVRATGFATSTTYGWAAKSGAMQAADGQA